MYVTANVNRTVVQCYVPRPLLPRLTDRERKQFSDVEKTIARSDEVSDLSVVAACLTMDRADAKEMHIPDISPRGVIMNPGTSAPSDLVAPACP